MKNYIDKKGDYVNCENFSLRQIYEHGRKQGMEFYMEQVVEALKTAAYKCIPQSTNSNLPNDAVDVVDLKEAIKIVRKEYGVKESHFEDAKYSDIYHICQPIIDWLKKNYPHNHYIVINNNSACLYEGSKLTVLDKELISINEKEPFFKDVNPVDIIVSFMLAGDYSTEDVKKRLNELKEKMNTCCCMPESEVSA